MPVLDEKGYAKSPLCHVTIIRNDQTLNIELFQMAATKHSYLTSSCQARPTRRWLFGRSSKWTHQLCINVPWSKRKRQPMLSRRNKSSKVTSAAKPRLHYQRVPIPLRMNRKRNLLKAHRKMRCLQRMSKLLKMRSRQ